MKKGIHPELYEITALCACGNTIETRSTMPQIRITICAGCHPFFTGEQKFVDSAGQIERFKQRYAHVEKNKKK